MQHERRLVAFFFDPTSYPHSADQLSHHETHVSHVFLAGAYAYKIKKAVRFPFIDASTLALRRHWCLRELALNRRLAPWIYLGVVPVTQSRSGAWRLGGRGLVVEWAIRMRRLPEERMLDRLIEHHRATRADLGRLMDRLIPFFRRARRGRSVARHGRPDRVAELVLGNLRECEEFVGSVFAHAEIDRLERSDRQWLTLHAPLLTRRVREGWIIEGHGDLRGENICLTDPVTVFDCVEHQAAFRCGDVVNDVSFLVMDLEHRGRPTLAKAAVDIYRRRLPDPAFDRLLPFYACHRSLVRAKVRALAWRQHPRTAAGRRALAQARRHAWLARAYAGVFAPPRLIVVGGLIGTGKSTLARQLAQRLGAVWLRSDEIRLREFAGLRRPGQGFSQGVYAPRVSVRVYERLIARADAAIRGGESVVCDGTFSLAVGRERLRRIAWRHGASFHFLQCVVPAATAKRRIARRLSRRADLSEARPEYYARMRAEYEPVRGWPKDAWTSLPTSGTPEQTLQRALTALRRAWLNNG